MPNIIRCGSTTNGTLAKQITNFYATIGDAKVVLTWSKPSDSNYSGVMIVRKTGGYPQRVLDGVKVYAGTGTSFTDTGLTNGTQYYYRAFAYNSKREYQTAYCVAIATPLAARELGTFPVGTKVKFGSLYGSKIVWRIADKSGSNITLITDGVITRHAFDAAEPNNNNSDVRKYGSGSYIESNILQWLRSSAGAGSWYTAQHSSDYPPNSSVFYDDPVVTENPYADEAGFLNEWTAKEINYLKTTTRMVGESNTNGVTESYSGRIWLPSGTEMGLSTDFVEGTQLSAFSDDNSRIAYETADCAAHTGGTAGVAQSYWLRTPVDYNMYYESLVYKEGGLSSIYAYRGDVGVRPLCVLDSSVLFSADVDADNCYTLY